MRVDLDVQLEKDLDMLGGIQIGGGNNSNRGDMNSNSKLGTLTSHRSHNQNHNDSRRDQVQRGVQTPY